MHVTCIRAQREIHPGDAVKGVSQRVESCTFHTPVSDESLIAAWWEEHVDDADRGETRSHMVKPFLQRETRQRM